MTCTKVSGGGTLVVREVTRMRLRSGHCTNSRWCRAALSRGDVHKQVGVIRTEANWLLQQASKA
jgi:hypothetical protein